MTQSELITSFYQSFQNRDSEGMVACYHPEVRFSDPVFSDLQGPRAGAMWRMLVGGGADLELTFSDVTDDSAKWEARYSFGPKKRAVHNIISAKFRFQDDLIIEHTDSFDFWRWSKMALGLPGVLMGWTPFLQNQVRKTAGNNLEKFIAKNGL